ncbi:hypothetical protein C1645_818505 [Glomus cerebriforme]|uniref:Uncharacterized protein n=1 Tax=Glomus cerebriforme TaxID=658196 RepID=A0A397T749_9GLOM|nr:hypothetical protein C1645_818505 [Glomus cerebriforme]
MTNINTSSSNKSLEEDNNKIIDKLGISFNKLSNLLKENQKSSTIYYANYHPSTTKNVKSDIYGIITHVFPQMLNELSTKCNGANDIIRAWPIKIRQQIYGFPGSLGFADISPIQEPVIHFQFFPYNTKINPNIMDGRWDVEDMDDNLLAELCSFPILMTDGNEKDQKIYTYAKVIHQVKPIEMKYA